MAGHCHLSLAQLVDLFHLVGQFLLAVVVDGRHGHFQILYRHSDGLAAFLAVVHIHRLCFYIHLECGILRVDAVLDGQQILVEMGDGDERVFIGPGDTGDFLDVFLLALNVDAYGEQGHLFSLDTQLHIAVGGNGRLSG